MVMKHQSGMIVYGKHKDSIKRINNKYNMAFGVDAFSSFRSCEDATQKIVNRTYS